MKIQEYLFYKYNYGKGLSEKEMEVATALAELFPAKQNELERDLFLKGETIGVKQQPTETFKNQNVFTVGNYRR